MRKHRSVAQILWIVESAFFFFAGNLVRVGCPGTAVPLSGRGVSFPSIGFFAGAGGGQSLPAGVWGVPTQSPFDHRPPSAVRAGYLNSYLLLIPCLGQDLDAFLNIGDVAIMQLLDNGFDIIANTSVFSLPDVVLPSKNGIGSS